MWYGTGQETDMVHRRCRSRPSSKPTFRLLEYKTSRDGLTSKTREQLL